MSCSNDSTWLAVLTLLRQELVTHYLVPLSFENQRSLNFAWPGTCSSQAHRRLRQFLMVTLILKRYCPERGANSMRDRKSWILWGLLCDVWEAAERGLWPLDTLLKMDAPQLIGNLTHAPLDTRSGFLLTSQAWLQDKVYLLFITQTSASQPSWRCDPQYSSSSCGDPNHKITFTATS